ISLSSGTLDPVFETGTFSYLTYVSNTTNSISITPHTNNADAIVELNGTPIASGSSASIPLSIGSNLISTIVVSGDGTNTSSYNIKVTRLNPDQIIPDPSGDALAGGTVSQVVVVSATRPIAVTIPAGTTSPSIAYGNM